MSTFELIIYWGFVGVGGTICAILGFWILGMLGWLIFGSKER